MCKRLLTALAVVVSAGTQGWAQQPQAGILGHQRFDAFGPFVVEKGAPGVAEERGELCPGIR